MIRRTHAFALIALVGAPLLAVALPAEAKKAHFVKNFTEVERQGDNLVVSVKEAGLADNEEVVIVISADAECINGGGKNPNADNKDSVSVEVTASPDNGNVVVVAVLEPDFQPPCTPQMDIEYSNIVATDTTNTVTLEIQGTF